ncbi:hypothetical protein EV363DRAFT_1398680 [Boletus edulis]|nr:hypothetical protein EV363DRAFT_1398680 [Boletus edulis]
MDTCVRNGLYAEALALAAHATTALSALSTVRSQGGGGDGELPESDGHTPPLPLVSALQAEIASSLHAMRLLLLGTLHEPGRKLPAFWKAVQFLRRMQVMPESELALAFVSARIDCLQNAFQAVERDAGVSVTTGDDAITGNNAADREKEMDRRAEDVARFLKKYIDVWREGAYDLVTQYTTIFLERSSPHGSASSSHLPATTPLPDPVIKHTLPPTLLGLLLPTVKTYFGRAYPQLAPLATQLAYCSSATARIGMDFRLLLSPVITDAVIDGFTRDMYTGAEREWTTTLARHTSPPSGGKSTPPSKWLVSTVQPLPVLSAIVVPPSSAAHTPPQVLTAFTPLAITLNTYLRALNRLRALAPMAALDGVRDALELGLARGGEALLGYARAWGADAAERDIVRAVGAAYVRVLVPFLRRAVVEGVFGIACDPDVSKKEEGDSEGGADKRGSGASALRDIVGNWESWLLETGT